MAMVPSFNLFYNFSHAKISYFHCKLLGKKNAIGGEISVDDTLTMEELQSLRNINQGGQLEIR